MWHTVRRAAFAAGAATALLAPVASASAATTTGGRADQTFSQTVDIPLQGTIDHTSRSDPQKIDVAGTVHVVAVYSSKGYHDVRANATLSGTTGTGETSGATYQFTGSDPMGHTIPPGQPASVEFFPTFVMHSPNAGPKPLQFVTMTVDVASDGSITGVSATVTPSDPRH